MATIADLLTRLHTQAWDLAEAPRLPSHDDTLGCHQRSWVGIAAHTRRIHRSLGAADDLDGLIDHLRGLRALGGPQDQSLDQMSETLGGIADLLIIGQDDVVHADQPSRARLITGVRAGVHVAARATLEVASEMNDHAVGDLMDRLAAATEPAAMAVPDALGPLGHLATRRPEATDLRSVLNEWTRAAADALAGRWQTSSYALQSTAAAISLIAHKAAATVELGRSVLGPSPAIHAMVSLRQAGAAWQEAAVWPPTVTIGGRNPELRITTSRLVAALASPQFGTSDIADQLAAMRVATRSALQVAHLHQYRITKLNERQELWVAGGTLPANYVADPPQAVRRSGWFRQPSPTAGAELVAASAAAHQALTTAASALEQATQPILLQAPARVSPPWETVTPTQTRTSDRRPTAAEISPHRGILGA